MRHTNAVSSTGPEGFICCLLGHEQYALHAADVRIVARAEQMRLEATTSAGRVGTLEHGGRPLPVYSLSALFGRTPDRSGLDRHVIVTRGAGGESYGLLVDRLLRAPADHPGRLLPIPATVGPVAAAWFHGLLTFGGDLSCLVLSPAALDPRHPAEMARPADTHVPADAVRRMSGRRDPVEIVATFTSDALPNIGIRRFALGAHRVAAVAQALPSIAIPGAVAWVAELARWRDYAVPVLSFNAGAPSGVTNGSRRCLVVRTGGRYSGGFVAFAVNADIDLHRATSANGDAALSRPVDAEFVIGIYMVGPDPVALLDIDRLAAGVSTRRTRAVPAQAAAIEPLPVVV
jgi:chemotaxis signal transduction protein